MILRWEFHVISVSGANPVVCEDSIHRQRRSPPLPSPPRKAQSWTSPLEVTILKVESQAFTRALNSHWKRASPPGGGMTLARGSAERPQTSTSLPSERKSAPVLKGESGGHTMASTTYPGGKMDECQA